MTEDEDSDDILPIEDDYSDEELELFEEIDDPVWQEKVREYVITCRELENPDLDSSDRKHLLDVRDGLKSDMASLRVIHRNADTLRDGGDVDLY